MAAHIHIPITGHIGDFEDEYGYMCYGFRAQMIDWMLGWNWEDGTIGHTDLEKVTFLLNTDGGSVVEGFEIMARMDGLKEKGVIVEVINESRAYSCGSFLLQGASKGHRMSRPYGLFMAHKPWGGCEGNADEMRKYADYLDKYEYPLITVYATASGKTKEEVAALLREERYLTADEALAEGFIDVILPIATEGATPAQVEKKAVAYYNPNKLTSNQIKANTMTEAEEKSLFAKFKTWIKGEEKGSPAASAKPAPKATIKPTPKPKAEAEVTEVVAATTETADGATIHFEGETLEQGTQVFADAELTEALEDGEYDLADGRTIEVVEGAVANITEAEEEAGEDDAAANAVETAPVATKKPAPKAKAGQVDQIKAMQDQIDELKKLVPGSGQAGKKGAQSFNEGPEKKVNANNPLNVAAGNASRKRN